VSPDALGEGDLYLLAEGTFERAYEKLGAHLCEVDGVAGTRFAVWAPNARRVSVIGDFNGWSRDTNRMQSRGSSGIWEAFVPGIDHGTLYKYAIESTARGYRVEKADPYGFASEERPRTASRVWDLSRYAWGDAEWMNGRARANRGDAPISVYEVHLGSWMRSPEEGNRWLTYREVAPLLADYVAEMGYTHVEFLPLTEHPFDGSWGYQATGYFAPTSRFGTPDGFMFLVDTLHRRGIGVILDWVPSHFPNDEHGLGFFDGTNLYEHADPRQGFHPDWNSLIFNYGRNEVRSFLLSSALFWLDRYHIDGLRVDAVASMLYLDYSRKEGEWIPNVHGGRENLEAISLLRLFNERVYGRFPDVLTVAEESTSWPMVSRPTYVGGLGFGLKWDMGWMHDSLDYASQDPIHRRYYHDRLTFRGLYAFTENFMLPLSHDEVVHGKRSLLDKMPGDHWQKFANLRALLGYQWTLPGKKLLFMGCDFGQWREWNHDVSLDWHHLEDPAHQGVRRWVQDLNRLYRSEAALHETDLEPSGFEWIDCGDADQSVISYLRRGKTRDDLLLVACNFTPIPRPNYLLGVPRGGRWEEALNGDSREYGGSGQGNLGGVDATPVSKHGRTHSVCVTLPPLAVVVFRSRG